MSLTKISRQTMPGVFHANSWGTVITREVIFELIKEARSNPNNKARLCLHPSPDEISQVTFLAFSSPYKDKIHKHPHHTEIMLPILGLASYILFNQKGLKTDSRILSGKELLAVSTPKEEWHAIEVLSDSFVMVEIGSGPFTYSSTVYM